MNLLKTLLGAAVVVSAQMALAAPPSIMVLPEKNWCIEHGYTKTVKDKVYPDYEKAIGDKEFRSVNTAFQQLFAERGFPMVDATAQSEEDDMDDAMDEAFEGAESGASAGTNAFDELVNRAKPDITVEVECRLTLLGRLQHQGYRHLFLESCKRNRRPDRRSSPHGASHRSSQASCKE